MDLKEAANLLRSGAVGVAPTDTIYGLLGAALSKKAVECIYRLRKRNPKKPVIILIASPGDTRLFGARIDMRTKRILKKVWPGKVSVILRAPSKKFFYLHRGTKTLAFRLPKPKWLRDLIKATGPLAAPSANIEGKPPARTIREAKKYFGKHAAFYLDAGRLESLPSTLVRIEKGKAAVLRRGAAKVMV